MIVTIASKKQDVVLVEYSDNNSLYRVWIPRNELVGNNVSKEVIRRGVQYGLPWSKLLSDSALADERNTLIELERQLRLRGIWTLSDLLAKPNILRNMVNKITETILATVVERARQYCSIEQEKEDE